MLELSWIWTEIKGINNVSWQIITLTVIFYFREEFRNLLSNLVNFSSKMNSLKWGDIGVAFSSPTQDELEKKIVSEVKEFTAIGEGSFNQSKNPQEVKNHSDPRKAYELTESSAMSLLLDKKFFSPRKLIIQPKISYSTSSIRQSYVIPDAIADKQNSLFVIEVKLYQRIAQSYLIRKHLQELLSVMEKVRNKSNSRNKKIYGVLVMMGASELNFDSLISQDESLVIMAITDSQGFEMYGNETAINIIKSEHKEET